jgi:hypothetical protein
MNDLRLSIATKKLLAAARVDVPSAAARGKVWAGVSGAIGGGAGAGGSGATASTVVNGGASATKFLTLGGLFGAAVTVGLATAWLKIGPAPAPPPHTMTSPATLAHATLATPTRAVTEDPTHGNQLRNPEGASTPARSSTSTPSRARIVMSAAGEGSLAHEASLVAEARSALGRGDPDSALRAIRAARALSSRQLVPEELAVQEQALRALGQSDEANGIDVQLRLQYPESALAR